MELAFTGNIPNYQHEMNIFAVQKLPLITPLSTAIPQNADKGLNVDFAQ